MSHSRHKANNLHFNSRGEPCNCGFNKFQPQIRQANNPEDERYYNEERDEWLDPYFHAAPTEDRARVQQHGLMPSRPGQNPAWQENERNIIAEQPEGVYLSEDPTDVMGPNPKKDVWRIDPNYVKEPQMDRIRDEFEYTQHPIPPEALTLHQPFENSKRGLIQQWEQAPGYEYKDPYSGRWNLPKEWGIGLPDRVIGKTADKEEYDPNVNAQIACPNCGDIRTPVTPIGNGWTFQMNAPRQHDPACPICKGKGYITGPRNTDGYRTPYEYFPIRNNPINISEDVPRRQGSHVAAAPAAEPHNQDWWDRFNHYMLSKGVNPDDPLEREFYLKEYEEKRQQWDKQQADKMLRKSPLPNPQQWTNPDPWMDSEPGTTTFPDHWGKTSSPNKDEIHLGLDLPDETSKEIARWADHQEWPEGMKLEPIENYHITVFYCESGRSKGLDWIGSPEAHSFTVDKLEVFPSKEKDESAVVLLLSSDGMKDYMERMMKKAEAHGLKPNRFDGHKPHITIAYGPKVDVDDIPLPKIDEFNSAPAKVSKSRESKVAAAPENPTDHWLQYNPDEHEQGKGFILQNGAVWTWPTQEWKPIHAAYDYKLKMKGLEKIPSSSFNIYNGNVFQHGEGRYLSPEQQTHIIQTDPRLRFQDMTENFSPELNEGFSFQRGFGHGQNVLDILEQPKPWGVTGSFSIANRPSVIEKYWDCPECNGVGCPSCAYTGEMQPGTPTEPMEEEPSIHGDGVQFGNDEPGVQTIGA